MNSYKDKSWQLTLPHPLISTAEIMLFICNCTTRGQCNPKILYFLPKKHREFPVFKHLEVIEMVYLVNSLPTQLRQGDDVVEILALLLEMYKIGDFFFFFFKLQLVKSCW